MIPWIVLAFLASCSQGSRPRGIRAEVTFDQLNTHCWSDFCKSLIRCGDWWISSRVCVQVASMYNPGSDFRCFDGSNTVPFIQVNDDYCDCEVRWNTSRLFHSSSKLSDFHPIFPLIRMAPTSQAPPPVPTAGSSVRMQDTKPWSFPLAGWVDPGQS